MIHALKTEIQFFAAVADGTKPFEVRVDDRDYAVGDFLALNEWEENQYTGRCLLVSVSYILRDPRFCKGALCTMGIVPCCIGDGGERYGMMSDRQYRAAPIYERKRIEGRS